MIADTTARRFYYIYDSRERRAVVLDRNTGGEYTRRDAPRDRLMVHVQARRSSAVLRQFARWCARQVGAETVPVHTPGGRLWTAAQQTDRTVWRRARHDTTDAAAVAVALGLSREQRSAARLLVLQACTHPDSEQAALDAAHMSERWAEFGADSDPAEAVQSMRARHVDWMLDALGAA